MDEQSVKPVKNQCLDCACEIFDVMAKYDMTFGQVVQTLAGVVYASMGTWHQKFSKEVFEEALEAFVSYLYPKAESEESKELETLLKKHFV